MSILYAPGLRRYFNVRLTPMLASGKYMMGEARGRDHFRVFRVPALFQHKSLSLSEKSVGGSPSNPLGAQWVGVRHKGKPNEYIQYKTNPVWYWLTQIKRPAKVSIIEGIIAKHETLLGDQKYHYQGLEFDIPRQGFNPTFGKVSTLLLEYAKTCANPSSQVLDLGTGTGYYAIALAKQRGCVVTGVDIDEKEIAVAQSNAFRNGVEEKTTFYCTRKNHPFEMLVDRMKFDLIIANLPFSRTSQVWKSRKHPMAQCFHGSRSLLEMLILGSAYHIEPDGRLVFAYSDSGYKHFLDDLIEVSPWIVDSRKCVTRERDDSFYIYDLKLSEDFASLIDNRGLSEG
ncbi:50S ribosomal protein L11 methyltransferase [Hahella ganghwensis]|uniref:50S ribosomal protein L11 methyltransferase n=1 Tax=Hahella ganghwensis TaxID=286420 RepID=UPI000476E02E|nr:50S ribosomal protein L11 methyltransferase [Hahella ganghwensis]